MLGSPEYEFVAPGFLFAGQPSLRRAMLLAYGLDPSELTPALSRRLTAYILLHEFIDITQVDALFPGHPPQDMDGLLQVAWSF
jgi:hygromycin-B 7''-O-kinase